MSNKVLFFGDKTYEIRRDSSVEDFNAALTDIYGEGTWAVDEKTYPVEIFVPKGEASKWREKVGFLKNYIFGGDEVYIREYSANAARFARPMRR
jgi:hypothetical protein